MLVAGYPLRKDARATVTIGRQPMFPPPGLTAEGPKDPDEADETDWILAAHLADETRK